MFYRYIGIGLAQSQAKGNHLHPPAGRTPFAWVALVVAQSEPNKALVQRDLGWRIAAKKD